MTQFVEINYLFIVKIRFGPSRCIELLNIGLTTVPLLGFTIEIIARSLQLVLEFYSNLSDHIPYFLKYCPPLNSVPFFEKAYSKTGQVNFLVNTVLIRYCVYYEIVT